ncbi:glycosyltransferase family 2 protein [Vreelandella sp. 2A-K22]
MDIKEVLLAEKYLFNGKSEDAVALCLEALRINAADKIALTLMLRSLNKNNDLSKNIALQKVLSDFISLRIEQDLDTMSVWPLVSICNKYIMRSYFEDNKSFPHYLENRVKVKRNKTKLLMLTCVWQRHDLTRMFYEYYKKMVSELKDEIELEILVVGSEGEVSKKMCEEYSFNYIERPNQPLSEKWQGGADYAKEFDFDALVIMGSDDFVSKEVFLLYKEMIDKNVLFFGFQDLYLYDVKSMGVGHWKGYGSASKGLAQPDRVGETIGLGRMLSRSLLEYLDFNLWKGFKVNKSLDGLMKRRITRATGMLPISLKNDLKIKVGSDSYLFGLVATTFEEQNLLGLDVKHSENVTAFKKYGVSTECYEKLNIEDFKSYSIYNDLLKLSGSPKNAVGLKPITDVKKKVSIGIPSYNRNESLNTLITDIYRAAEYNNVDVNMFIYDDASDVPVTLDSENDKYKDKIKIHRSEVNGGKKCYWKTVNHIFLELSKTKSDFYYYLPDDVRLNEDFFEKSISSWCAINDPKKISLNLLEDGRVQCWTGFTRVIQNFNGLRLYKTQWLDMALVFDSTLLRYRLKEIPLSTWDNKPLLSSGVGAQLSKRFYAAGFNMYQVRRSLVHHGEHESKMNYEERKLNPLVSEFPSLSLSEMATKEKFRDKKIVCGVAVIESRWDSFRETVDSIIDQVDKLYIYQNGFKRIEDFLRDSKIVVISSLDTGVNRGDAGKFYMLGADKNCIYFSIDDDLYYPGDYVQRTLKYLAFLNQPCVVSYHGRVLSKNANCYYDDIEENYKCLNEVNHMERVEFAGTGVMAFDTEKIDIDFSFFEKENMADIWMGIFCKDHGFPMYVLPHTKEWISHNEIDFNNTIFVKYKTDKDHANSVLRERYWKMT